MGHTVNEALQQVAEHTVTIYNEVLALNDKVKKWKTTAKKLKTQVEEKKKFIATQKVTCDDYEKLKGRYRQKEELVSELENQNETMKTDLTEMCAKANQLENSLRQLVKDNQELVKEKSELEVDLKLIHGNTSREKMQTEMEF